MKSKTQADTDCHFTQINSQNFSYDKNLYQEKKVQALSFVTENNTRTNDIILDVSGTLKGSFQEFSRSKSPSLNNKKNELNA